MKSLFGLSGGLTYHTLAARYAKTRWQPFKNEVRRFFTETWNPRERELVIFGPSAGWTLPLEAFERFDRIVVVEPDSFARWVLQRRLGSGQAGRPLKDSTHPARVDLSRIEFVPSKEILPWFDPDRGTKFREFLEANPNAAILFSNLLGQIPLLDPTRPNDEARRNFLDALTDRNWASYHDAISANAPFRNPFPTTPPPRRDVESLAQHYFLNPKEVVDHETRWLDELGPTTYAPWALKPTHNHLIAFTVPKRP